MGSAHHHEQTHLQTFGDRAFSVAALTLWKSILAEIRNAVSLECELSIFCSCICLSYLLRVKRPWVPGKAQYKLSYY